MLRTDKNESSTLKTTPEKRSFNQEILSLPSVHTLARWNIDNLYALHIAGKKFGVEENKTLTRILKDYGGTMREVSLENINFGGKVGLCHCSSLLLALNLESLWCRIIH